MIEEGPLFVGPQHFLAVTLDGLLPRAAVPNDVPVTMRMVEYIVGGAASLDTALMKDCYLWQVNPARLTTFFQEADAAGISWDKVEASDPQTAVEELRSRFRSLELSYDQRVVTQADVTAPPPVVGYLGHITGSSLVGSDADPEVLFQLKALMTGHFNAASCAAQESDDLRATLIASVGRDISNLPLAAQAALVVTADHQLPAPPPGLSFQTPPTESPSTEQITALLGSAAETLASVQATCLESSDFRDSVEPTSQPMAPPQRVPEEFFAPTFMEATTEQQKKILATWKSPDEQKVYLARLLLPLVEKIEPMHAGQVTTLLFKLDTKDIWDLIESPTKLERKVAETMAALTSDPLDREVLPEDPRGAHFATTSPIPEQALLTTNLPAPPPGLGHQQPTLRANPLSTPPPGLGFPDPSGDISEQ